ncbi:Uu.00g123300.m01.CDS01 [Anthostomella pinea]|uniref:Uu.00g123300.m01.CDS01 n=1 Tax=Anthostomella pinea TaxID=933095 RepID=A0AAI8YHI1_9PEZI|nr:Uu.00g123300.m01.CDS01 [Anthostomella pinea]
MADDSADQDRHVRFPELERSATAADEQQRRQDDADRQAETGRRRSSSDPLGKRSQRPGMSVIRPMRRMSNIGKHTANPDDNQNNQNKRMTSTATFNGPNGRNRLDQSLADVLDVIDPEVSTLNNVTNIQNSLFVPDLGRFINRRPTFNLSMPPQYDSITEETQAERAAERAAQDAEQGYSYNFNHAVLPDGVSLVGWTDEEMDELNDHVRHMLHSRRSKFKRTMKAFGQYVRKPLGFFVTLYATLITLFGLAWVLFIIGWIYVGERQLYIMNVIDYVLVALFAVVGDGMIPFRLIDTYHMAFIAHYHHLTWKLRKKKQMADLQDKNDLPTNPELEEARDEVTVLSEDQQATLVHHQNKFAKSHTFYKPHETRTHYAFPLDLLVAVVTLLDVHSCLQVSLGATTWGIDYHTRPPAITATILSCSIAVNITAGILITIGGRKTRKKDVVERMFRQELTREAIDKIRHQGKKEGDVDKEIKAERALEQTRQTETLDEAMKSDIPAATRGSIDKGRQSLDSSRRSMDNSRRSVDNGRRSIDKGRRSEGRGIESMDRLRPIPSGHQL